MSAQNKEESYLYNFSSDILLNRNQERKYIYLETTTATLIVIVTTSLEIMLFSKFKLCTLVIFILKVTDYLKEIKDKEL